MFIYRRVRSSLVIVKTLIPKEEMFVKALITHEIIDSKVDVLTRNWNEVIVSKYYKHVNRIMPSVVTCKETVNSFMCCEDLKLSGWMRHIYFLGKMKSLEKSSVGRGFCTAQPCSCSVLKNHTEVYVNYELISLLAQASYNSCNLH